MNDCCIQGNTGGLRSFTLSFIKMYEPTVPWFTVYKYKYYMNDRCIQGNRSGLQSFTLPFIKIENQQANGLPFVNTNIT